MARPRTERVQGIPCARGTLVAGALAAIAELWGAPGMEELRRRLDPEARRVICEEIVLPVGWYPERHFESCCDAVWEGLAAREPAVFDRFIGRSVDQMWGRVHRVLMSLATPRLLASRAPDLWRHDHTHGDLTVQLREQDGTIRVRGYPYSPTSIMHRGQAESLRYILGHARVRDVRATHVEHAGGDFVVTLAWS